MSLVAIVGRPNVGKSTLFNRLVGMRQAIVDETAGVTRDRHYGKCEWCGREFSVVDTGGWTTNSDDVFEQAIRRQVVIAIEEADVVLFMVEAATGITDYDAEIADLLRRSRKPVVLCVNKVDSGEKIFDTYQFYSLGLGEIWSISAANGSGTGDLLDEVVRVLPEETGKEDDDRPDLPHIAIVGKPNVGKSSLTNALLGEERNIVTPVAGTTRDSISTYYNKFNHEFMLVDTAGMRKKSRVSEDLEFYSVMRSIRAIEKADVCILMIDANSGMEAQDMSIFNLIVRNRKACVLVVNKWDLFLKDSNTMKEYEDALRRRIAPFDGNRESWMCWMQPPTFPRTTAGNSPRQGSTRPCSRRSKSALLRHGKANMSRSSTSPSSRPDSRHSRSSAICRNMSRSRTRDSLRTSLESISIFRAVLSRYS